MNVIRTIILAIAVISAMTVSADKPNRIIIVNGNFFSELPAVVKSGTVKQNMKMFFIETPNETKALGIYSPDLEIPEDALQFAIPIEDVTDGEELLRRFNEQKNAGSANFSIVGTKPLVAVGDVFPEFSATDITSRTWTNADVAGKVMVLNVWFTGCGPCRREMPELSIWKEEMPDVMFFSSTYEAPEIARQVLDKTDFNWTHLVNNDQFNKWIGGNGYPLTIVVDKSGKIAAVEYGTSPEQRASLKHKIQSLR